MEGEGIVHDQSVQLLSHCLISFLPERQTNHSRTVHSLCPYRAKMLFDGAIRRNKELEL